MAWTTPKTWTAGEVVGETDMNTHIRDNLTVLKSPPFAQVVTASAGNYSTTATTAVPISTANLSVTITTYGDPIHAYFQGTFDAGGTTRVRLNFTCDGTAVGDAVTGLAFFSPGGIPSVSLSVWITGQASGSHTIQPVWHVGAGTQTGILYLASAPAILWAREG